MDFRLTPKEQAFRAEVRAWIAANLPPGWGTPAYREPETAVEKVAAAKAWQARLHGGGWAGITWPREYGGRGRDGRRAAASSTRSARAARRPTASTWRSLSASSARR